MVKVSPKNHSNYDIQKMLFLWEDFQSIMKQISRLQTTIQRDWKSTLISWICSI